MFRSIFIILGFTITLFTSKAQQFSTEFFTVKQGLPQSQVLSLAEDKKLGYLWVGTNGGGLAKFDGKAFTSYTVEDGIRDNSIHKIFIDSHDNIWAGTSRGLSKFDGKSFKNFDSLTNVFTQLVEFNDTIFALSVNHRLIKIVNDSVYCKNDCWLAKEGEAKYLLSDSPDCFYFFVDPDILIKKNKQGNSKISLASIGYAHNFFSSGDSLFIVSTTGTYVWGKHGLRHIDSRVNFPLIHADKKFNTLWRNSDGGLEKITRSNSSLRIDKTVKDVWAIRGLADSEKNSWFGTDGKGLIRYHQSDFELIKKDIVMSVLESNKKLWVATMTNGIDVMENNQTVKHFDLADIGFQAVAAIKKDLKGNVWICGGRNLARVDAMTYQITRFTSRDGIKPYSIMSIEVEPTGKIWICYNGGGLAFWNGERFEDYQLNNELSSKQVWGAKYSLHGDRLMVCTGDGVYEIKNGKISKLAILKFNETITYCAALYNEKYVIFGSGGQGLCIYNLEDSSVKYYAKKDGLVSGLVYFVDTDEEGYVWVGSNLGIERIKFNDQLEIDEYVYYSDENGLIGVETNLNASFISGKNKYFGLVDGLYKFAKHGEENTPSFKLHFTNVELIGSKLPLSKYSNEEIGFFHIPNNPQLPYNENSISFSFTKVSKESREPAEYKFILEGLENEWSLQKAGKEVSYRNLAPGSYTFKVIARDLKGKWGVQPLTYSFIVLPPFYKTTLFIIASILFIILLSGFIIYYNIRHNISKIMAIEKVKADENIRLRKEIGRDFHDEIGNQLARIVNYIGLIKLNHGNNTMTLTRVEESAKSLISGTKDFIWALDHENDSATNLFVHTKDFGDRLFVEKEVEFRAFYEVRGEMKLPIGYIRQLNLILKEAMTNSFRHSNATLVDLSFKELLTGLKITLKDNGTGISTEQRTTKQGGLVNMKVRAERIGTEYTIDSSGKGTEISLVIKL